MTKANAVAGEDGNNNNEFLMRVLSEFLLIKNIAL